MKIDIASLVIIIMVLSGCKYFKGPVDGGPCSYKTTIIPAEVVLILPMDSTQYDVFFAINNNHGNGIDTITYYSERHRYLNKEDLTKNDIEVGKKYNYEIKEILSGSCNPYIEWLTLNTFNP